MRGHSLLGNHLAINSEIQFKSSNEKKYRWVFLHFSFDHKFINFDNNLIRLIVVVVCDVLLFIFGNPFLIDITSHRCRRLVIIETNIILPLLSEA